MSTSLSLPGPPSSFQLRPRSVWQGLFDALIQKHTGIQESEAIPLSSVQDILLTEWGTDEETEDFVTHLLNGLSSLPSDFLVTSFDLTNTLMDNYFADFRPTIGSGQIVAYEINSEFSELPAEEAIPLKIEEAIENASYKLRADLRRLLHDFTEFEITFSSQGEQIKHIDSDVRHYAGLVKSLADELHVVRKELDELRVQVNAQKEDRMNDVAYLTQRCQAEKDNVSKKYRHVAGFTQRQEPRPLPRRQAVLKKSNDVSDRLPVTLFSDHAQGFVDDSSFASSSDDTTIQFLSTACLLQWVKLHLCPQGLGACVLHQLKPPLHQQSWSLMTVHWHHKALSQFHTQVFQLKQIQYLLLIYLDWLTYQGCIWFRDISKITFWFTFNPGFLHPWCFIPSF
ncbi:hypothetical protein DENSPDRAFT_846944 [Dentipellis sp. KUC8613]|nr:hypothetical protein DENSPDRAFT_846944 [Dentipellis sp. KUC8613]